MICIHHGFTNNILRNKSSNKSTMEEVERVGFLYHGADPALDEYDG